jgi:hypothetical protein
MSRVKYTQVPRSVRYLTCENTPSRLRSKPTSRGSLILFRISRITSGPCENYWRLRDPMASASFAPATTTIPAQMPGVQWVKSVAERLQTLRSKGRWVGLQELCPSHNLQDGTRDTKPECDCHYGSNAGRGGASGRSASSAYRLASPNLWRCCRRMVRNVRTLRD